MDAKIGGQQFFKQFPARRLSITEETASAVETDLSPDAQRTAHSLCSILTQKAAPSLNHEDATNPAGNTLISTLKKSQGHKT